jgi:hypothetical protein
MADRRNRQSKIATIIGYVLVSIPGALFGSVLGFWLVVETHDPVIFFGVIGVSTALFAFLSVRLGLQFWEEIRGLPWFLWR